MADSLGFGGDDTASKGDDTFLSSPGSSPCEWRESAISGPGDDGDDTFAIVTNVPRLVCLDTTDTPISRSAGAARVSRLPRRLAFFGQSNVRFCSGESSSDRSL